MPNDWQYRQDDLLKGAGDPNAMLELLRGDSPSLGVNPNITMGEPSEPSFRAGSSDPGFMGLGRESIGKQNLTANRLLYSPEMTALFTPGVTEDKAKTAAAIQSVNQGEATIGPSPSKIDAAKRIFSSDDFAVDQATKSQLTGEPMPTNEEDKNRLAPLTTTLKDQAKKVLDANMWSQFDPQMLAASGYGPTQEGGATGQTDALIAQWKRENNLQLGGSYEALQQLGIEFPGTGRSAPVFQPDAPARAIGRATLVQQPTQKDTTGLTSVVGSEFGEVDNPARGGYTEANWDIGKWGHPISGKDTKLVALPQSVLKSYGQVNDPKFADKFNANYEVQVVNPDTGAAVAASLGDIGPGASTGAGIDLTWGTRQQLNLPTNFKGRVQYRIVKKGSTLPDGTTSTVASTSDTTDALAAATGSTQPVYIQPLNPRELRDPAIYGDRNSTEDNLKWARHQTDLYATEMAHAGTPIDTDEYKKHFDSFYEASQQKAKGAEPKQLDSSDLDRFSTLTNSLTQMDALLAAKKKAGAGGMLIPNDDTADFKAKRDLLVGIVAKGLGGNVGSLSDADVKRVNTLLPTEWDSWEESQRKIAYTKQLTQQQMESAIRLRKAGHYDTSGLEKEYFKLYPALDQAKENQKWVDTSAKVDKQLSPQQQPPPGQPSNISPAASTAPPQPSAKPLPLKPSAPAANVPSNISPAASTTPALSLSGNEWWKKLKIG